MRRNIVMEAVIGQLESVGIKPEIERTIRHYKVRWLINGNTRLYVVSSSPSCRLAHKKAKCDIRRMLREDGVIDAAEKNG